MSILIEGMEMPPAGRYAVCITHDSKGGIHWVFQNQDTLEFLKHGAVAEVTEPHGRLIDADKLKSYWEPDHSRYFDADYFIHTIDVAQTIIPASKEG